MAKRFTTEELLQGGSTPPELEKKDKRFTTEELEAQAFEPPEVEEKDVPVTINPPKSQRFSTQELEMEQDAPKPAKPKVAEDTDDYSLFEHDPILGITLNKTRPIDLFPDKTKEELTRLQKGIDITVEGAKRGLNSAIYKTMPDMASNIIKFAGRQLVELKDPVNDAITLVAPYNSDVALYTGADKLSFVRYAKALSMLSPIRPLTRAKFTPKWIKDIYSPNIKPKPGKEKEFAAIQLKQKEIISDFIDGYVDKAVNAGDWIRLQLWPKEPEMLRDNKRTEQMLRNVSKERERLIRDPSASWWDMAKVGVNPRNVVVSTAEAIPPFLATLAITKGLMTTGAAMHTASIAGGFPLALAQVDDDFYLDALEATGDERKALQIQRAAVIGVAALESLPLEFIFKSRTLPKGKMAAALMRLNYVGKTGSIEGLEEVVQKWYVDIIRNGWMDEHNNLAMDIFANFLPGFMLGAGSSQIGFRPPSVQEHIDAATAKIRKSRRKNKQSQLTEEEEQKMILESLMPYKKGMAEKFKVSDEVITKFMEYQVTGNQDLMKEILGMVKPEIENSRLYSKTEIAEYKEVLEEVGAGIYEKKGLELDVTPHFLLKITEDENTRRVRDRLINEKDLYVIAKNGNKIPISSIEVKDPDTGAILRPGNIAGLPLGLQEEIARRVLALGDLSKSVNVEKQVANDVIENFADVVWYEGTHKVINKNTEVTYRYKSMPLHEVVTTMREQGIDPSNIKVRADLNADHPGGVAQTLMEIIESQFAKREQTDQEGQNLDINKPPLEPEVVYPQGQTNSSIQEAISKPLTLVLLEPSELNDYNYKVGDDFILYANGDRDPVKVTKVKDGKIVEVVATDTGEVLIKDGKVLSRAEIRAEHDARAKELEVLSPEVVSRNLEMAGIKGDVIDKIQKIVRQLMDEGLTQEQALESALEFHGVNKVINLKDNPDEDPPPPLPVKNLPKPPAGDGSSQQIDDATENLEANNLQVNNQQDQQLNEIINKKKQSDRAQAFSLYDSVDKTVQSDNLTLQEFFDMVKRLRTLNAFNFAAEPWNKINDLIETLGIDNANITDELDEPLQGPMKQIFDQFKKFWNSNKKSTVAGINKQLKTGTKYAYDRKLKHTNHIHRSIKDNNWKNIHSVISSLEAIEEASPYPPRVKGEKGLRLQGKTIRSMIDDLSEAVANTSKDKINILKNAWNQFTIDWIRAYQGTGSLLDYNEYSKNAYEYIDNDATIEIVSPDLDIEVDSINKIITDVEHINTKEIARNKINKYRHMIEWLGNETIIQSAAKLNKTDDTHMKKSFEALMSLSKDDFMSSEEYYVHSIMAAYEVYADLKRSFLEWYGEELDELDDTGEIDDNVDVDNISNAELLRSLSSNSPYADAFYAEVKKRIEQGKLTPNLVKKINKRWMKNRTNYNPYIDYTSAESSPLKVYEDIVNNLLDQIAARSKVDVTFLENVVKEIRLKLKGDAGQEITIPNTKGICDFSSNQVVRILRDKGFDAKVVELEAKSPAGDFMILHRVAEVTLPNGKKYLVDDPQFRFISQTKETGDYQQAFEWPKFLGPLKQLGTSITPEDLPGVFSEEGFEDEFGYNVKATDMKKDGEIIYGKLLGVDVRYHTVENHLEFKESNKLIWSKSYFEPEIFPHDNKTLEAFKEGVMPQPADTSVRQQQQDSLESKLDVLDPQGEALRRHENETTIGGEALSELEALIKPIKKKFNNWEEATALLPPETIQRIIELNEHLTEQQKNIFWSDVVKGKEKLRAETYQMLMKQLWPLFQEEESVIENMKKNKKVMTQEFIDKYLQSVRDQMEEITGGYPQLQSMIESWLEKLRKTVNGQVSPRNYQVTKGKGKLKIYTPKLVVLNEGVIYKAEPVGTQWKITGGGQTFMVSKAVILNHIRRGNLEDGGDSSGPNMRKARFAGLAVVAEMMDQTVRGMKWFRGYFDTALFAVKGFVAGDEQSGMFEQPFSHFMGLQRNSVANELLMAQRAEQLIQVLGLRVADVVHNVVDDVVNEYISKRQISPKERTKYLKALKEIMNRANEEIGVNKDSEAHKFWVTIIGNGGAYETQQQQKDVDADLQRYLHLVRPFGLGSRVREALAKDPTSRPRLAFFDMLPTDLQKTIIWTKGNYENTLLEAGVKADVFGNAQTFQRAAYGYTRRVHQKDPRQRSYTGGGNIMRPEVVPAAKKRTYSEFAAAATKEGLEVADDFSVSMADYVINTLRRIRQLEMLDLLKSVRNVDKIKESLAIKTDIKLVMYASDLKSKFANEESANRYLKQLDYKKIEFASGLARFENRRYEQPYVPYDIYNLIDQMINTKPTNKAFRALIRTHGLQKRLVMPTPQMFYFQILSTPALYMSLPMTMKFLAPAIPFTGLGGVVKDFAKAPWKNAIEKLWQNKDPRPLLNIFAEPAITAGLIAGGFGLSSAMGLTVPWFGLLAAVPIIHRGVAKRGVEIATGKVRTMEQFEGMDPKLLKAFMYNGLSGTSFDWVLQSWFDKLNLVHPNQATPLDKILSNEYSLSDRFKGLGSLLSSKLGIDHYTFGSMMPRLMYHATKTWYDHFMKTPNLPLKEKIGLGQAAMALGSVGQKIGYPLLREGRWVRGTPNREMTHEQAAKQAVMLNNALTGMLEEIAFSEDGQMYRVLLFARNFTVGLAKQFTIATYPVWSQLVKHRYRAKLGAYSNALLNAETSEQVMENIWSYAAAHLMVWTPMASFIFVNMLQLALNFKADGDDEDKKGKGTWANGMDNMLKVRIPQSKYWEENFGLYSKDEKGNQLYMNPLSWREAGNELDIFTGPLQKIEDMTGYTMPQGRGAIRWLRNKASMTMNLIGAGFNQINPKTRKPIVLKGLGLEENIQRVVKSAMDISVPEYMRPAKKGPGLEAQLASTMGGAPIRPGETTSSVLGDEFSRDFSRAKSELYAENIKFQEELEQAIGGKEAMAELLRKYPEHVSAFMNADMRTKDKILAELISNGRAIRRAYEIKKNREQKQAATKEKINKFIDMFKNRR